MKQIRLIEALNKKSLHISDGKSAVKAKRNPRRKERKYSFGKSPILLSDKFDVLFN
jgi:hypothetical protein